MTRKHFQAIADSFKATRPEKRKRAARAQWGHDVQEMARTLSRFNSAFDFVRFVEACGMGD
jgi:hypothetical protein